MRPIAPMYQCFKSLNVTLDAVGMECPKVVKHQP